MITSLAIVLLTILFVAIGVLHFYWVFGGKWGYKAAVPEVMYQQYLAHGSENRMTLPTAIVGVVMFGLAYVALSHLPSVNSLLSDKWLTYISWGIVVVFSIRAIGDFKMVGLFQEKTDYIFSVNDRKYYSPLCLVLAGLMLIVVVFT